MLEAAGEPVTRENYIGANWNDDPPDPWTPEDEAELPEFLQDKEDVGDTAAARRDRDRLCRCWTLTSKPDKLPLVALPRRPTSRASEQLSAPAARRHVGDVVIVRLLGDQRLRRQDQCGD